MPWGAPMSGPGVRATPAFSSAAFSAGPSATPRRSSRQKWPASGSEPRRRRAWASQCFFAWRQDALSRDRSSGIHASRSHASSSSSSATTAWGSVAALQKMERHLKLSSTAGFFVISAPTR